jgi:endonuclease YncB( thermonuclease family)
MRIACAAFLCLFSGQLAAAEVSGVPRIIDADTVAIGAERIRLGGIDAPETDQICLDARGQTSNCGIEARKRLQEHAGALAWTCQLTSRDRYGRSIGTCVAGGEDVSRWLVRNGWALAFRSYSTAYVADEDEAREHKNGLWAGAFVAPWDWRHRGAKTIILGALDVPIDAQHKLMAPNVGGESPRPAASSRATSAAATSASTTCRVADLTTG